MAGVLRRRHAEEGLGDRGAAVSHCDARVGRGGTWADDDTILFGAADTTLMRVSAAGGTPAVFGALGPGATSQRWPQVLPGGQAVLFTEHSETGFTGNWNAATLVVVSPDGRRVAVTRIVQGNADLWLQDGTRMIRFTFDPASDLDPVWSPDGTQIAFRSNRAASRYDVYQKLTNGTGVEERLVASDRVDTAHSWSTDGRFLLYGSAGPYTSSDLWVLPVEGDRTPWVFLKTPFVERYGQFSPDGRWVA